jgi:hypothetical protein
MAAFAGLCIDNEAKPPNLDVSLAMASESLSFTVTAILSASVGSDIPWIHGLAQDTTICQSIGISEQGSAMGLKASPTYKINVVFIHERTALVVDVQQVRFQFCIGPS